MIPKCFLYLGGVLLPFFTKKKNLFSALFRDPYEENSLWSFSIENEKGVIDDK